MQAKTNGRDRFDDCESALIHDNVFRVENYDLLFTIGAICMSMGYRSGVTIIRSYQAFLRTHPPVKHFVRIQPEELSRHWRKA